MNDLPQPLTPADCDLRDFAFMPLDVARLRDSDLAALESPEACWAALLLWCASWHQVPCASLPDDDRILSKIAGYGRVLKEWLLVKDGAMRGWVKCSDGRLYHPVVAEKANESWTKKTQYIWGKECDRIRKENKKRALEGLPSLPFPPENGSDSAGIPPENLPFPPENKIIPPENTINSAGKSILSAGIPPENALKGEGEGEGEVNLKAKALSGGGTVHDRDGPPQAEHPTGAPLPCREDLPPSDNPAIAMTVELRKLGVNALFTHPAVQDWTAKGVPIEILTAAVARARETKGDATIPPNYLVGIVDELLNPPAMTQPRASPARTAKFDPVAHVNRNRIRP